MTRRVFSGPVASVEGFEVGIGDERKIVIDGEGNVTSEGSLIYEEGFVGDLTGNVTGDVTGNVVGNLTGHVDGTLIGEVDGILYGYVQGALFGDFISAVAEESASQLPAAYGPAPGTWRMFVTSTGGIAVLTTAGTKILSTSP